MDQYRHGMGGVAVCALIGNVGRRVLAIFSAWLRIERERYVASESSNGTISGYKGLFTAYGDIRLTMVLMQPPSYGINIRKSTKSCQ